MNNIALQVGVKGRFKIEAVKADGSKRLLVDWFDNLILNNGLDLLGQGSNIFTYCCVGSGNSTPVVTQTALDALVASTSTQFSVTRSNSASSPYYGYTTLVFRFNAGTATGNLSEVGVGLNSTSLFSRALILDGGMNPTTITVLASEALDVTYQLQIHSPTTDSTNTVTVSGTPYTWTARTANAASSSQWAIVQYGELAALGAPQAFSGPIAGITSQPSGNQSTANGNTTPAYSNGTYAQSVSSSWGLTVGNLAEGTGYVANNSVGALISGGSGFSVPVATVNGNGTITAFGSFTAGSGFTDGNYYSTPLTGGTGSGGVANIFVNGGVVTNMTLVNGGLGYTNTDTLSAVIPGGSGFAVVVPTVSVGGGILSYGAITPGSGYNNGTYLNVPITGGSGSGALANITVAGGVVTAVSQGGIQSFLLSLGQYYGSLGSIQIGLDGTIPKDSTKTLSLGFNMTWGRYP